MAKTIVRELRDVEVVSVSLVKKGANRKKFICAKSENGENTVDFEVSFIGDIDNPDKILYGIVYAPNETDTHGDFMSAREIEKSAHRYMEHYGVIDTEHNLFAGAGKAIESYIAPCDLQINGNDVKAGSWVIAVKASDDSWDLFKAGEVTGFSFFGFTHEVIEHEISAKSDGLIGSLKDKLINSILSMKSVESIIDERLNEIVNSHHFIIDAIIESTYQDWYKADIGVDKMIVFKEKLQEAIAFCEKLISNKEEGVFNMKTDNTENIQSTETEVTETQETTPVDNQAEVIAVAIKSAVDNALIEVNKSLESLMLENKSIKEELVLIKSAAPVVDGVKLIATKVNQDTNTMF